MPDASRSREFPSDPACYDLLEDCGRGVSATVHRAVCKATNEVVAVKKMNLERVNMKLVRVLLVAGLMPQTGEGGGHLTLTAPTQQQQADVYRAGCCLCR